MVSDIPSGDGKIANLFFTVYPPTYYRVDIESYNIRTVGCREKRGLIIARTVIEMINKKFLTVHNYNTSFFFHKNGVYLSSSTCIVVAPIGSRPAPGNLALGGFGSEPPPPPAFGLIYEVAIGQQDRRHLFETTWL